MQQEKPGSPDKNNKVLRLQNRKAIGRRELIEQLRKDSRWNLSSKKYSLEHLEAVFGQLTAPQELGFLWLQWNGIEGICKMAVRPQYASLKIMNLGGNKIVSVQPLQHAHMPALEELWLWSNLLTRVDSLRKMCTLNLKYLDLSSNRIAEWKRFHQLQSKKLQLVNLQNNLLGCTDDFAKTLTMSSCQKIISLGDNCFVRVFGQRGKVVRRGEVLSAAQFKFPSKRVDYK